MKRLWEDVTSPDQPINWNSVHYWIEFSVFGRAVSLEIPRWLHDMIVKGR